MPLCICYVLLSPTWGMHQYTADLANRQLGVGVEVHLITTAHYPRDRYAPGVSIHTPVAIMDTGFSLKGLRIWDLHGVRRTILDLKPNLVHFTGPHLWNPLLLCTLRRAGVPTVHTLHDLHPHAGATYGRLLYLWNAYVRREANHLLVHGQCYLKELLRLGHISSRVTCTPLVFLPVSHAHEQALFQSPPAIQYGLSALFLGRLEIYKGLDMLIEALAD
jgi:glycosyltransferase involved in cell wall biosynthesis